MGYGFGEVWGQEVGEVRSIEVCGGRARKREIKLNEGLVGGV